MSGCRWVLPGTTDGNDEDIAVAMACSGKGRQDWCMEGGGRAVCCVDKAHNTGGGTRQDGV